MNRLILIVILGLMQASSGVAQVSTPPVAGARKAGCFKGGPLPECRSFWLTEASYFSRLSADHPFNSAPDITASVLAGHMWNVGSRTALGGGISIDLLDGLSVAIRPRVRYWLGRETALDLSPGLVVAGLAGATRFTGEVAIISQDRVGFSLRATDLPAYAYFPGSPPTPSRRMVFYGGLKLGSKLGVAGAVLDVAALGALIAAYLVACRSGRCD